MTIETAKRIIEAGQPNKEAEAVVRGGMTICKMLPDGRRDYLWIKVRPTKTDTESSIDAALEKSKKKAHKLEEPKPQEKVEQPAPTIQSSKELLRSTTPTFVERLKEKLLIFWKELDSIVVE